MKKLTAERCKRQIEEWQRMMSVSDVAVMVELNLQAYLIALPILEQQERGEGDWIEWGGGNCPILRERLVLVKLRGGQTVGPTNAKLFNWHHGIATKKEMSSDIIAYRIIPEREESCSN